MNSFEFIGKIIKPKDINQSVKVNSKGYKTMKLIIRQNETNSAYVQLNAEPNYKKQIAVRNKNSKKIEYVDYENRFDVEMLKNVSYVSKVTTNLGCVENTHREFICKSDFIDYVMERLDKYPNDTLFKIRGEFVITEYKGKLYNNFNIKSLNLATTETPQFTMKLDLFYNNKSLDESDKRNKFVLNAYLEQYSYHKKMNQYFPIQVEFITNRYDFKKETDVEVIKHRKINMNPTEKEGYVKAKWEAQYVRGAQMILPPLETLPADMQFEIKNAGRDIKDYMSNVVGEAKEFICLTRPDNTLNKDGKVYTSLNVSDNEFESQIIQIENNETFENTIDNVAKTEAKENPFN